MTEHSGILVVDDTLSALKLLTDILVAEKYQVRPANSGELALVSAVAAPPELILLDIRMPGMDGFEVCRRLKANPPTRDIPVILISAATALEDRVKGFALGAVDFISKPFQREELLARVRNHLELDRLKARLEARVEERTAELNEQAEIAQRRASELETIIWSITDTIFICDKDGRLVDVNEAGLKLIGLQKKPEISLPLVDYLRLLKLRHPDGRPITNEQEFALWGALHGETVLEYEEIARDPRSVRDICLLVSAVPIRNSEGNFAGAVVVMSDITRLRELDLLKDQFVAVAAHELKTPVAIMKGYAQALLRSSEDLSSARRRSLDAINRGADRINNIIQDLLDISLLHVARLELRRERTDLSELMQQVVDRLQLTIGKHDIRIVKTEPLVVQVDRERIEQVLLDLLDNAIRYSPMGGDIEIALTVKDGEAEISVKDCGIGIPADKQVRIFDRFYRAHTGTPYDYGGMGVSLYIAKEIITQHGGHIWFESEEGKGSTFHFTLPVA